MMLRRSFLAAPLIALCNSAAAGIVFSGAADLGNNNGVSSNLSASYTVGTGQNRILVICMTATNGNDSFTATYNGVTMSGPVAFNYSGSSSLGSISFYYLVNPATGSNMLSVTDNVQANYIQVIAADYANANQNNQPDTTGISTDTGVNNTYSGTFATIQNAALAIGCANNNFSGATAPTVSGSFTRRTYAAQFNNTILADYGPVVPAGNVTLTATITSGGTDKQSQSFLSLIPAPSGGGSLMMTGVGH